MKIINYILFFLLSLFLIENTNAQDTKRPRPAEWDNLVLGGRFMDRFQPISPIGKLTSDTWGAEAVKPRYVDNGIEDPKWSYWGGNIKKGSDGLYHLMVCRWPESAEKGHMEWSNSEVVHAVSENSFGPFKVKGDAIGKGHNPEFFRLSDGRYVIYIIGAYYISDSIDGPWEKREFDFDPHDREIIDGLSNVSFSQREDGSFLAVCRGGGIWISKTGISPYYQVTNKSVYPPYDGRYEDPVIWRTNVQYHMIVNDWYGRIAYHLRSKDGVNWKVDAGEAYMPGIARYTDGTVVDWYKYERIKMLQDEYGRAVQANFAVIDSSKWADLGSDHHSSKNICIPLVKGSLLTIMNKKKVVSTTELIRVKIEAEDGFNPHSDIELESLRFGASEKVNFGWGSKLARTEKAGADLILVFEGKGNGLTNDNFTGKLLGKTSRGVLLFGYARLPWVSYNEPILSARAPVISSKDGKSTVEFKVQNFGQVPSDTVEYTASFNDGEVTIQLKGKIPALKPYGKERIIVHSPKIVSVESNIIISIPNQIMPLYSSGEKN